MKRKLFSAILFGALLTASTSGLTSCKDYDDDISNLQSQIDKLATKEELQKKAEELSTAIGIAQQDANNAKTVAEAAQKAADAAATSGDVDAAKKAAIDAANQAVADLKKELEGSLASKQELEQAAKAAEKVVTDLQSSLVGDSGLTIDQVMAIVNDAVAKVNDDKSGLDALEARLAEVEKTLDAEGGQGEIDLDKIKAELEDIEDSLEEILGTALTMVTSVDLFVSSYTNYDTDLNFWKVKELEDITFPANKETGDDTFAFTKDNVRLFDDALVVRVSPIDATLTPDMVSLINSQGAEVSKDIVEVESVEPYEGDLLTRSSSNNGLWVVNFKVADNKQDELNALAWTKKDGQDAQILYAVAVNNTKEVADTRRVISAYDVTMKAKEPKQAIYSDIKINKTSISDIHNRITKGEEGGQGQVTVKEYVWKENKPAVTATKDNTVEGDNREIKSVLPVAVGENIAISIPVADKPIRGFYVTLDSDRAVESQPSEINAWNSYKYVNVGKAGETAALQEGNYGYIQVADLAGMSLVGDVIGFRIFAINLDGTLVDPDGVAFYVGIKPAAEVDEVALAPAEAKIKFASPATLSKDKAENATAAIDLTEAVKGVTFSEIDWSVADVKGYNNHNSGIRLNTSDFAVIYFKANGDVTTKAYEAASMKIQIKEPQKYIDDTEYTFTGVMKNTVSTGNAQGKYDVRKLTIKVTKAMPWGEVPVNVTYNALQNKNLMVTATSYDGVSLGTIDGKKANENPQTGSVDLKKFLVYSNSDNSKIGSSAEYQKYTYKVLNSMMWQDPNDNNKWKNTGVTTFAYSSTPADNYISSISSTYVDRGATKLTNFIDCSTEHHIKAYYQYGNISHRLKADKSAYENVPFNAEADQTPTVVFMSWSYQNADYTTWKTKNYKKWNDDNKAWDRINLNQVIWQADNNVGTAFNITNLQIWAVFGLKSQVAGLGTAQTGSTVYNGVSLAQLFTRNNLKVTEAYTLASGIKNAYFEPVVTNGTISQFKQISKREGAADHTEQLVIKVVDCFNYVSTITVNFDVVSSYNVTTTGYVDCTGE